MRRWSLALVLVAACGPKPPARTALEGDLPSLKRDIASAQQAQKLDHAAVVDLALAVGEREVMSAGGTDGALRVRSLRPCAKPLLRTMARRAEAQDDVAAELTLILLETHTADRETLLTRYARASSGAWRAVAARAAVRQADTDVRVRFFSDPDERVRRSALAAAHDAREPAELEALLEAARLDPDPESESLATRAAGAIGGERAVLGLKDLWAQGDEPLRMAIVDAWLEPGSLVSGGERELSNVADSAAGLASVSASFALARAGGPAADAANARLRRSIAEGSDDEKRLALSVAPLSPENEAAIAEAAKKASPELRVTALTRLSALPNQRTDAVVADAGDTSVRATLIKSLSDKDRQTRLRAARGLTSLGDYSNAATALGDDDASLRSDLACTILARESLPAPQRGEAARR